MTSLSADTFYKLTDAYQDTPHCKIECHSYHLSHKCPHRWLVYLSRSSYFWFDFQCHQPHCRQSHRHPMQSRIPIDSQLKKVRFYFCISRLPKVKNTEVKIKNTVGIPNIITLSRYLIFLCKLGICSKSSCSRVRLSSHPSFCLPSLRVL